VSIPSLQAERNTGRRTGEWEIGCEQKFFGIIPACSLASVKGRIFARGDEIFQWGGKSLAYKKRKKKPKRKSVSNCMTDKSLTVLGGRERRVSGVSGKTPV